MTKTHAAEFTLVESIPTPPPLGAQALYSAKVATTTLHEGDENTKILQDPPPHPFYPLFRPDSVHKPQRMRSLQKLHINYSVIGTPFDFSPL